MARPSAVVDAPHSRSLDDRELLARLIAGPATGDALAEAAGLTRAAVWKRIQALRAAGVEIDARPGRGYILRHPLELLDVEAIRARLPPPLSTQLATLDRAWSLDSTNSELLRRSTASRGVDVLLAERQTGGRGRRGREWASPLAAHLYMSMARQFSGGLARLGGLSLVAGIAAVEALHALGFDRVRLKWPNDLVVCDDAGLRKLGGLLIEGSGEHAGPVRAVIGLGLNVRMPDAFASRITQPWIDLATLSTSPPSRNAITAALLTQLLPALDQFDRDGLAPFLPRFDALDALAGRAVTLHAPVGEQHGIALGVAADGALRVRLDMHDGSAAGESTFHSGEVSVRAGKRFAGNIGT